MSLASIIVPAALGTGGLFSGVGIIYGVWTQVKDRDRSIHKQDSENALTDEQRRLIQEQAAKTGTESARAERIESEKWWSEQIEKLRRDLDEEQQSRRELTDWANLHQIWDRRAWVLALETDPDYPPPPTLGATNVAVVKRIQDESPGRK